MTTVESIIEQQSFKVLAESIPQLVWTAEPDGYTDWFNQRWVDYTGHALEESVGYGWNCVIHPDDLDRCLARWTSAFESEQSYETEYRILRRDGVFHWHIGRALPVKDANGRIIKWFGTCTDIHAQKTLMEERQDFTSALAHDLKAPLIGSNLVLDMMLSEKFGTLNQKQVELSKQVLNNNRSILELLQRLLDFYRQEKELNDLRLEMVDLVSLLSDCVGDVKMVADSRDISLRFDSGEQACTSFLDRLALRRVFLNLLDNALKFTPSGGTVKVVLSRIDQSIQIAVHDTGSGIAEEEFPLLFQPFSQGETGKRYSLGSGLGLYLCRHIVEAHQGQISCLSDQSTGSTFVVTLPSLV